MQGRCHVDCEQYCLDRCTLDGQRESPCKYECDPLTKQCFDLCDLQMYDPSVELNKDQFYMECTKRFAKRSAAAWTLDAAKPDRAGGSRPQCPRSWCPRRGPCSALEPAPHGADPCSGAADTPQTGLAVQHGGGGGRLAGL